MKNKTMLDAALCDCGENMDMLEYVYNETYSNVYSVCYSVLSNTSLTEDAAQDTYIRLARIYKKYRSGTNPLAFILKVAVNVAKEHKKASRRYIPLENEYEKGDDGKETENTVSALYTDQLLKHLDEKQRMVVMLYVFSDLNFDEIATVVGSHPNTVRSRYKKALEILKKEIIKDEK